jgi:parallel beta-helix repeat protein
MSPRPRSPRRPIRPRLEALEARALLSSLPLVVTNTTDSGPGSLRQAILTANLDTNLAGDPVVTINFQITSGAQSVPGTWTITPASALPSIVRPVTINAETQAGYSGSPLVEIQGTSAGSGANGLVLYTGSGGSTVEGLVVGGFGSGVGILARSAANTIQGNWIGTDATGKVADPNIDGVFLLGSTATGNLVGGANHANADGTVTRTLGNVVSGNSGIGILIENGANGNTIEGNTVGLDVTGEAVVNTGPTTVPNYAYGIFVLNCNATQIGGTDPVNPSGSDILTVGNVVTATGNSLIKLNGATGTKVQGNYLGTDAAGESTFVTYDGLSIINTQNALVGGPSQGQGNLISLGFALAPGTQDAPQAGPWAAGAYGASQGTVFQGNFIGFDARHVADLGNPIDGLDFDSAQGVTVTGNTIIGSPHSGIDIYATDFNPAGVWVTGNSIYASGRFGIALNDAGNTPNHTGGLVYGPNGLQNHPVLTSAVISGGTTTVSGTLNGAASTAYTVEFFANPVASPSGFGEGEVFIGSATVTTDGSGNQNFALPLPVSLPPGWSVSSTATDPGHNTSEFSNDVPARAPTTISVGSTTVTAGYGQPVTYGATVTGAAHRPAPTGTITFYIDGIPVASGFTSNGSETFTTFTPPTVGAHTVTASYGGDDSYLPSTTGTIVSAAGDGFNAGGAAGGDSGDGGPATAAELNTPHGVAVDAAGDLFIADTNNNVIREVVKATGNIITVAGTGVAGYNGDGLPATSTQIAAPYAVTVDLAGDVFFSDTGNHLVRKIVKATGLITTVAGDGALGYSGDGGPALSAALNSPRGLAFDAAGDMLIADSHAHVVREVLADSGNIITFAGNGGVGNTGDGGLPYLAQIGDPDTVVVDQAGNVLICDTLNSVVREVVAATGRIVTFAGTGVAGYSGDGGPPASAQLSSPLGLALDPAGDLFIADNDHGVVREVVKATGKIITVAGADNVNGGYSGNGGPALSAVFHNLRGLATDAMGDLFITDALNHEIREVTPPVWLLVTPSAPVTSLASSAVNSVYGQPVTLTATVAGPARGVTATGAVTFYDGATALGSGTLDPTGAATLTTATLAPGTHSIVAVYAGDATYTGSPSAPLAQSVAADPPAVGLRPSANPAEYHQPLTFTATVSPTAPGTLTPTGFVQFKVNGVPLGSPVAVSGGVAVSPAISSLTIGAYSVTASFTDTSGEFQATALTLAGQKVLAFTSTSLSANTESLAYGQLATFTAAVTNLDTATAVTGSVSFYDGAKLLGSAAVSGGRAVLTTSALAAGPAVHTITAVYNGAGTLNKSTSNGVGLNVSSAPTATALAASTPGPVPYGTAVSFTATVTNTASPATPTGTVSFLNGSTLLGRAVLNASGVATFRSSTLAPGEYSVSALYAGTANFQAGSSAALDLTVSKADTAASLTSTAGQTEYGQPVTFHLSVANTDTAPVPTGGAVTFYLDYGTPAVKSLGSAPLSGGAAAFTTKPNALPGGSHTVTAVYAGTVDFTAATSNAVSQSVSPAGTSVALASTASGTVNFGTAVTFTATVTDPDTGQVPAGQVQFFDGTTLVATVALNLQGKAAWTKSLARGSHSITAVYVATANFSGSTSNAVGLTLGVV